MKNRIFASVVVVLLINSMSAQTKDGNHSPKAIAAGIYNLDKDGLYVSKYPNGSIESKGAFITHRGWRKKAYKDGIWKYYNENGTLKSEELYKKGLLIETKEYDENGNLKVE